MPRAFSRFYFWHKCRYDSRIQVKTDDHSHAEHVHTGQSFHVKPERSRQLEAIKELKLKQQQLYHKEAEETDQSLLYGNPIGTITVDNLHQLPLLITITRWFKVQSAVANVNTVESQAEASEAALHAQLQRTIQDETDLPMNQAALMMKELSILKAQYADLVQKAGDIVRDLRHTQATGRARTQNSMSDGGVNMAAVIYNYVFTKHPVTHPTGRDTPSELPDCPAKTSLELDSTCLQEIAGSSHHYAVEKATYTPTRSCRSSIWGLEDACTTQETFDLAALEKSRWQPISPQSDVEDIQVYSDGTGGDRSTRPGSLTEVKYGSSRYRANSSTQPKSCVSQNVGNRTDDQPAYGLADSRNPPRSPNVPAEMSELPPIRSIFGDNLWMSEILLTRTAPK